MRVLAIILLALASLLGACATNPFISTEGTSSGYTQAQSPQMVEVATVVATRDVRLLSQPSDLAQRTGTALGGLVGYSLAKDKSYVTQAVFGTLGAVVGMEAGRQSAGNVPAQELVIRTDKGIIMTVTQSTTDGQRFQKGQRVLLIAGSRVSPTTLD